MLRSGHHPSSASSSVLSRLATLVGLPLRGVSAGAWGGRRFGRGELGVGAMAVVVVAGAMLGGATRAQAQKETVLANFTGNAGAAPGANPQYGNLIQASDGNFYGLTAGGGTNNAGTAFKMTPLGVVTLLHSFAGGTADGQNPFGSLVQGTDGNFYGLTNRGGANSVGVVFEMTAAGAVTLLHSFAGGTGDGRSPYGNLVQGTDGNFYGMTYQGGAHNVGTAFMMTPLGAVTLLHSFAGGTADGENPYGSLVQGTDGNFYGMTYLGGAHNAGTAFMMTPLGAVTLLYSFAGAADGNNPYGSLVQGPDGNFYGLTYGGGAHGAGAAFQMTPSGAVTLLHSFAGTADGKNPYGSLVQGSDGNFYGLAYVGGATGYGTAFEMTSAGGVTLLHSFAGGTADGSSPYGSLVQGADGGLYGMTYAGGANSDGILFSQTTGTTLAAPVALSSSATTVAGGGAFTLTYSVANAYAGSTNGTNVGSSSLGYCFASNTAGNTTWTGVIAGSPTAASSPSLTAPATAGTYTYSLTCGGMESNLVTIMVPPVPTVTGVSPTNGTVSGGTGVTISGTSFTGATAVKFGAANAASFTVNSATQITATSPAVGAGVVDVTVTTAGGTSATSSADQFTYLRASVTFGTMSFSPASSETVGTSQAISISEAITYGGAQPTGAVTFVLNGVTYTATCTTGGSPETCTATVPAATIAALPAAGYTITAELAQDSVYNAGTGTSGTFTITPPYFVLANFTGITGAAPGATPYFNNLIQASDGNFYGLTYQGGAGNGGVAFKMTPAGVVTLLHSFGGTGDGATPLGSLVQGTDGNFYGLTYGGGANSLGTAFQMTPAGAVTVLHSFAGTADGQYPQGGLVQGTDGNFYGLTSAGGANNLGAAFQMTPLGAMTLLHSFAGTADGQGPLGSLVQGTDGNFYGLTPAGGANNAGVAFQMTPAGAVTLLHSFAGAADGAAPSGSLVQGTDGNFYGLTYGGGANGGGTAFQMTPAGVVTLLYSFAGTADGQSPSGNLVQGTDGNFYGLSYAGGTNNNGAAFQMTPFGAVTLLHSFAGGQGDGGNPLGSLLQGTDGNFYGMTHGGGSSLGGVIFKQTTATALAAPVALSSSATAVAAGGAFTLTYSVANAYTGATNGTNVGSGSLGYCFASNTASNAAWTGVIMGSPTAASSPSFTAPSTPGTYTYSLTCGGVESNVVTLTVFAVPTVTGVAPTSGTLSGGTSVTLSGTGFTGTTAVKFGTANATSFTVNSGTQITALAPAGTAGVVDVTVTTPGGTSATSSADQFTYLRGTVTFGTMSFSPASSETVGTSQAISISETITYGGAQPTGAVTYGLNGVTYTATCTTAGSPETCTATVPAATIAALPAAGYTVTAALAQDSAYNAGSGTSGTFNITPPYFVLASFTGTSGAAPGAAPYYSNLIQASDGNFYGMTYLGGANNGGAAFKMTSAGAVTLLHSFAGAADGMNPYGSLVQGTDGNFYGLTFGGGANSRGTAFQMTPAGAVTLLHSFAGGTGDGQYPLGSLVQGADGNFYGMAQQGGTNNGGAAFKMTPLGAVTLLHSFAGGNGDGAYPQGSLVQGTDGNFYGLTLLGGANSDGEAFKMTSAGAVTLLHSFGGNADGQYPVGSLAQGTDGNFYGLTSSGGANNYGEAFKMTPAGAVTLLHSFAGAADGLTPYGSLVQGTDGNFYGLTSSGGAYNDGIEFQMTPSGAMTLLHSFAGGAGDGGNPLGSLLQGTDGNFYGMTYIGGSGSVGILFKQTTATTLAAPVALSSSATTVYTGGAFTLTYSVANAYAGATNGTNVGSDSLGYCFASNTAGNTTWAGVIAGSPTAVNSPSLTAPSTAGTYTYSLTCGGTESNLVTLTVQTAPPPVITVPANMTVEATGPAGAVATFTATATDAVDGTDPVTCAPVSGSTFALGTTQVTCSATDSRGNKATNSFTVTVVRTTHFSVEGYPTSAILTEGGTVAVLPLDGSGNIDPYFTGTVMLTSSDAKATLPGAYTFQSSDNGVHTFNVTLNTLGTQSITATSGGVSGTQTGIAVGDAIWVVDRAGSLVKLNGAGSGAGSSAGVSGTSSFGGVAFDAAGDVWSVSAGANALAFATYAGGGATAYTGGGLNAPVAVAVDGAGMVWVANSGGNTISAFSNAGLALSPATGYATNDLLSSPSAIAVDAAGGLWVANKGGNSVTHVFGAATPAVTPLAGAAMNGTVATRP